MIVSWSTGNASTFPLACSTTVGKFGLDLRLVIRRHFNLSVVLEQLVLAKHHIEDLSTLMALGCDVDRRSAALRMATPYVSPALIWSIRLV